MGDYLKLFETHAEYESFIQTDYDKPNVSYCEDNNEVHYNPLTPPPMNIIRYEASAKLTETTSDKSGGLHPNKFGTTMVSHTFENGVGTIEFEDNVTTIGDYAFYQCTNLTNVIMPNSVTTIGDYAFYQCTNLTNVIMPNSVTSIGGFAFNGCTGLTSVTIPNSVTSIGDAAFQGCTSLTSITIPSGVTSIGTMAFDNCSGLASITIPSGVTSIGDYAFRICSNLTNVTIPNSVTSIGQGAFDSCNSLTSITVEATTPPTLGSKSFYDTNDCPIYVPSASVDTYKAAENWSTYASRIQAIPTT